MIVLPRVPTRGLPLSAGLLLGLGLGGFFDGIVRWQCHDVVRADGRLNHKAALPAPWSRSHAVALRALNRCRALLVSTRLGVSMRLLRAQNSALREHSPQ
jgi:hypothetical protein